MTKKDIEKLTAEQKQKWDGFLDYLLELLLPEIKEVEGKCLNHPILEKKMP